MATFKNYPPKPSAVGTGSDLIVAVGWHVYIHVPALAGAMDRVTATNDRGQIVASDFTDGQEVEVTAWQPRSRDGVLYRVKRLQDGAEGWVRSMNLRKARERPAA